MVLAVLLRVATVNWSRPGKATWGTEDAEATLPWPSCFFGSGVSNAAFTGKHDETGQLLLLKALWAVAWCSPPCHSSWCFPLMFYKATMVVYSEFSFWLKDQRELDYWTLGQCCWVSLITTPPTPVSWRVSCFPWVIVWVRWCICQVEIGSWFCLLESKTFRVLFLFVSLFPPYPQVFKGHIGKAMSHVA